MPLGGTAKKLQKVASAAEELYGKMNEVMSRLTELEADVERTSEQVDRIERDVAEQRALVEALAEAQGVDIAAVLDAADLPEPSVEEDTATEATDDATQETDANA
ncbi:MAG: DUF5798 family protein [Salinirussus sp.]